jgi:leader peptidase (prepilin peptidase)/N-methyltransferase
MAVILTVLAGLMLGSFLSVLIGRWPQWRGAATGRSHCPSCMHTLAWYDLIPLASWASTGGRCRYCRAPIPWRYPAYELAMAGALGGYAALSGVSGVAEILDLIILFALVSLFFFDVVHQMLPDAIVLPLGIVAVVRLWLVAGHDPRTSVLTGIGITALFGSLYVVSRGRWLGFGDVKLGLVIGLLFGYPIAVGITLLAVWAGALVGIVLMALHRATPKTALPFGAFWVAAAVLTVLWPAPVTVLTDLFIPAFR